MAELLGLLKDKIPVVQEVAAFGWLVGNKRVLTIDNLQGRSLILPNVFLMCLEAVESVDYPFMHCSFVCKRRKTVSGEDPSRADVFILTHTCKSGRPVDEASLRVMEQLNERISQQPETSQNSTGRNDLFSQVMGEDRHGRVRTYGLGPTPTDLWGTTSIQRRTQSRNEEYEGLQNEVSSLKSEVSSIKSEVSSLKSEFSSFKESVAQLISSRTNLKSTVSDNSANLNPNQLASSSSQGHLAKKGKTTTCSSTGDVIEVFLTSIRGVNVARGIVLSKDPLTKVGGFPLGNGFWEVYIQVAIVREETLMRPYGRYRTIGDAAGTSICWPDCCCSVVTAMD